MACWGPRRRSLAWRAWRYSTHSPSRIAHCIHRQSFIQWLMTASFSQAHVKPATAASSRCATPKRSTVWPATADVSLLEPSHIVRYFPLSLRSCRRRICAPTYRSRCPCPHLRFPRKVRPFALRRRHCLRWHAFLAYPAWRGCSGARSRWTRPSVSWFPFSVPFP